MTDFRKRIANWIHPGDRELRSFADDYYTLQFARAKGTLAGISSAEEIVGGFIMRCFAAAEVTGTYRRHFPRRILKMIARDLIIRGESVYRRNGVKLLWVDSYSLTDGLYIINGRSYPPLAVFHARYIEDRATGKGISPLIEASRLGALARQVESLIETESRALSSLVVPIPNTGKSADSEEEEEVPDFVKNMKAAQGRAFVTENPRGGVGQKEYAQPNYEQRRLGMDTPANVAAVYQQAHNNVLNTLGAPTAMYNGGAADLRDSVRLVCGTLVKPLIAIIEDAAADCGLPIKLQLPLLADLDLATKVRALQGMIASGLDLEEAIAATGIILPEDD